MKKNRIVEYILPVAIFFMGCGQDKNSPTDTSTSGSIHIVADDAYKPVVEDEIKVFESQYHGAHIDVKYETEDSVFKDLMSSDSIRFAIVARKLTKDEEDFFHSKTLFPEQTKIATDAMALIVNNKNPDSLKFTLDKVKAIFNGQDSTWDAIDSRSQLGKITVVFDHENSSNSRYIRDSINHGHKFPAYCFAVKGNPEVIDYVNKNPNAIGVISVNWISDDYDSTVVRFLSQVKVVGISRKESENVNDYYQPYQEYLKTGSYPLCRDVYVIKREARTGLGSGFISYITSDPGQRIILRAGLLPATVPTRILQY
ncbi:MAG TPA: substrate-binding domain-containing protein [Bacteroidia bacterium]|jgi:phosphate transport system substrate-binding protein|nr:substrate-binding domain-containing protein [Bacteroidia bacterium]